MRKKTLHYIILLGLLGTMSSHAQTQLTLNKQACDKFQQVDHALNQSYQKILINYKNNKPFIKAFKQAQRQWLAFRDAHLKSIYPDSNPYTYGSINAMCRCIELEKITRTRLMQIDGWLQAKEGDGCNGSRGMGMANSPV